MILFDHEYFHKQFRMSPTRLKNLLAPFNLKKREIPVHHERTLMTMKGHQIHSNSAYGAEYEVAVHNKKTLKKREIPVHHLWWLSEIEPRGKKPYHTWSQ